MSWNGDWLDLVQVATAAGGHEHSRFDMSRRHCSLGSSPTLALTIFLPLFCNGPWSLGEKSRSDVTEHAIETYFLCVTSGEFPR